MKIINIHTRVINQPIHQLEELFATLATKHDMMIATEKWPPMRLDKGLEVGSRGGHGPIRYYITRFNANKFVRFQFDMKGFEGFHQFEIIELGPEKSKLIHTIDMSTDGLGTIKWVVAIRWLHDAFIEDAFDKVESQFTLNKKTTNWNLWVIFLRKIMSRQKYLRPRKLNEQPSSNYLRPR